MPKGYTYILKCADDSYYTGSTIHLLTRFIEHQSGEGANYTKKRLPVSLLYFEEYPRIDVAFKREKQIQGWSRAKKEALIMKWIEQLKNLSSCKNKSHYKSQKNKIISVAERSRSHGKTVILPQ